MENSLNEGVDYAFVSSQDEDNNLVNVRLLSGDFSGVEYTYGKVSIEEDEKNDTAYLSFEYTIVESEDFEDLEQNLDFKNHIGDVLTTIIMKSSGENLNANGTDDTEEFDLS